MQSALTCPELYPLLNFNGLKKDKLYFHITGLDEYWHNQSTGSTTNLIIQYDNGQKEESETKQIPYRYKSLVREYATEWLCFRLFQLINQLHQ